MLTPHQLFPMYNAGRRNTQPELIVMRILADIARTLTEAVAIAAFVGACLTVAAFL
jgi:hypothetical protein